MVEGLAVERGYRELPQPIGFRGPALQTLRTRKQTISMNVNTSGIAIMQAVVCSKRQHSHVNVLAEYNANGPHAIATSPTSSVRIPSSILKLVPR